MKKSASILLLALAAVAELARAGLLASPRDYSPERSWPVVVSTQNNPSPEVMKASPFFLMHAGGQGVECTQKIEQYLVELAGRCNIDPFRVYATSFSRGGQEILLQTAYHPHWFAAIAPVCNDLRREPGMTQVEVIRTPAMMLHGTGDSFRKTGEELFDRMKAAGCPVIYRTYPGGHSPDHIWNEDPKVWMRFFAEHALNPYPTGVFHRVSHKRYSRAYWVEAAVARDAGDLSASFTVTVCASNRIEVKCSGEIAALDLHLSGKLVDMTRPVTVTMAEATLYEGPAAAKLTVKIRDAEGAFRGGRLPLWERMTEAGRKAGFAYSPIDLTTAVEAFSPPAAPAPAAQPR